MQQDKLAESWFLAQIKPNSHEIARRNLTRQGFALFLPLSEETRRTGSGFTTKRRPLFPGYLFVRLDISGGHWRAVNSTYGITRLVSLGNSPTPVPDDLVNRLMARCDSAGLLQPAPEMQIGDEVQFTKGPFAHLVATIEQIAPDKRIYVLLDLMGAKTRVCVNAGHLQQLHDKAE